MEDRQDAAAKDVGLDAHVQQPADGLGGAAGVKGAQQQVAGKRGLQGGFGGRPIAYFAHHDDLGVLPHEEPQARRKVQPDGRMHLRLRHAADRHFDRIFDRHQAPRTVGSPGDFAEAGVNRGRFAAARGPRHEDSTRRLRQQGLQRREHVGGQAEVVEMLVALRAAEQPHDRPLAVERRIRADPHFHVVLRQPDASFLRTIGLVGQQARQNLQAGDHVAGQRLREGGDGEQNAVDAELQLQMGAGRLEMDVGGAGGSRGGQQRIDAARRVVRMARVKPAKLSGQ